MTPAPRIVPKSRRSIPVIFAAFFAFVAVAGYNGYRAANESKAAVTGAQQTAAQFLSLMQQHQFAGANALLAPDAQERTPTSAMRSIEKLVEENHGTVENWKQTNWAIERFGGVIFVDFSYDLKCSKNDTSVNIVIEKNGEIYSVYSFTYQL